MKLNFIRDLILSIIEKQLAPLYSTKAELLLAREELDDYIGETDKIIEELEAQKKKYSNSNGAARVLFYFGEKEIISMFQKVTQPLPLASVSFKDVLGNAAKVDGVPAWSVTDSTLGTLAVSEDGMSAQPEPRYEPRAWLVTLPNGWESLNIEHQNAIQYAARNHGTEGAR
jgi:uncharacterized small protein (DUF1192 family)